MPRSCMSSCQSVPSATQEAIPRRVSSWESLIPFQLWICLVLWSRSAQAPWQLGQSWFPLRCCAASWGWWNGEAGPGPKDSSTILSTSPSASYKPSQPAESSGPPEEPNRKCLYNAHCHKVQTTHRGSGNRITDRGMLVSPWNMTIQIPFICSTNIWGFYTSQESQQWRKHIQRAREEAEKK